jgi:hypothetical protein
MRDWETISFGVWWRYLLISSEIPVVPHHHSPAARDLYVVRPGSLDAMGEKM